MRKKGKNTSITIKDVKDLQRIANRLKEINYPAYILWSIGVNTGYRGIDLVKLTIADLKEAIVSGKLIISEQKTEKTRKIPFKREVILSNKLLKILEDFIQDKKDSEFVYPSQKGKGRSPNKQHIGRSSLGKIFRNTIHELGISSGSVGVHTPRKTYGYFQYLEHNDIHYVQKLFGHSRPDITMNYIGLDEDILNESAETMNKYVF